MKPSSIGRVCVVLLSAIVLSACGGSSEVTTPDEQFGNLVPAAPTGEPPQDQPPEAIPLEGDVDTTLPPAPVDTTTTVEPAPVTTTTLEDTLPVSPSDASDDPRVTSEGIQVGYVNRVRDFGRGPEETLEAAAVLGPHSVLVVVDDERVADTATLDYGNWAANSEIFVVRLEAGPQVAELRLTSTRGGVDRVAPAADGLAVLAVRASTAANVTFEAFDSSGTLVATCEHDGSFHRCSE